MSLKFVCFLSCVIGAAHGAVIYNESANGDLSNSGLTPTGLTVALGSNQILGTTGNVGGTDRDYFTFAVPLGQMITSITVLPGTTSGGPVSFIGVESGSQLTLPPNTATAAGLLGWWHYSPADINTNILPEIGVPANGSSGFTGPLGAGNYAFWIQDFSPGTFTYGFDVTVAPAPEPAAFGLTVFAIGGLVALRRRRSA